MTFDGIEVGLCAWHKMARYYIHDAIASQVIAYKVVKEAALNNH